MPDFNSSLEKFSSSLNRIISHKIPLVTEETPNILDFSQKKRVYQLTLFKTSFNELISYNLDDLSLDKSTHTRITSIIQSMQAAFKDSDLKRLRQLTDSLKKLESTISYPKVQESLSFSLRNMPAEIADEMHADLKELEKCFSSCCYRASIILCGRLLETALHRKYFEATNLDILEKNPGIGLGTLVAKLRDKNIILDPAITQQIHLINQVRIYSVHRKKESFSPTKEQTHAIILYTLDVVKKLC